MKYKFPIIQTIDDVLPAIAGRTEFTVGKREHYTYIDYNYVLPDTFDCIIRRECRGIKFKPDGSLLARPFHKFFNLNERPETSTALLDFSQDFWVKPKYDGSMVHPVFINNEIYMYTRAGHTHITDQIEKEFFSTEEGKIFKEQLKDIDSIKENICTFLFEYISPTNRIVIPYDKPALKFLEARDNINGEYAGKKLFDKCNDVYFNVPILSSEDAWRENDIFAVMNTSSEKGIEGYVIQFEDGHMIKVKTDEYVLLHNTRSDLTHEKNVLKIVLQNKIDDLISLLQEEEQNVLREYYSQVMNNLNQFSLNLESIVKAYKLKASSRKEFAYLVTTSIDPLYQSILFKTYDSIGIDYFRTIRDGIIAKMISDCGSSTTLERWRGVIGKRWTWTGGMFNKGEV